MAKKCRNTTTSFSFNFFQSIIFIHYSRIKYCTSPVSESAVKQSPEKLHNGQQKDNRERYILFCVNQDPMQLVVFRVRISDVYRQKWDKRI